MNLSIETKVGMTVASIFTALTLGVMAQAQSGVQTGGPNNYGPTNNPGVNTHMSDQGYTSSLPGRTNAEENRERFSNDTEATTPRHAKKTKNLRSKNISALITLSAQGKAPSRQTIQEIDTSPAKSDAALE